jgi:hypothetical protein
MDAIHTSTHDDRSGTANETSDKITRKTGNKTRQASTHAWAPNTSPKLKSLQDLSIGVNLEVTKEVMHRADHANSSICRSSRLIPSIACSTP